ncbi:glycosyl hydrolase 2 galactose-binding domain-containing protein [Bifidobacterium sp. H6bp9]|uniref:glycoside hydrolase family 2 protein n=1 Tax=Bifidobacterium sp. H6bp9 TaxID=3051961 RepID=UPI0028BD6381|nr:sugar-binding domain-containing protein [Bifidobacterium sp. H6bp9]MDT7510745.1 glycoside hydrolase family 2 TIM barrel-domain containing protein [Bifidobacterium sp. H6bp9]
MNKQLDISSDWSVLQDVNDVGEKLRLYEDRDCTQVGPQISEWEPLPALEHLQCLLDEQPYWGRRLRYFNQAPWWYRRLIDLDNSEMDGKILLRFSNVDYFCKVWMNGQLLGSHEGYSESFVFDVSNVVHSGTNILMVKVWSPWDRQIRNDDVENRTYMVERRLVKGTYEHDDGLIARDVNPVGIYGKVTLSIHESACLAEDPRLSVWMDDQGRGRIAVRGKVLGRGSDCSSVLRILVRDPVDGRVLLDADKQVQGPFEFKAAVDGVTPWFTWDLGEPKLYDMTLSLDGEQEESRKIGFRNVKLDRDESTTRFVLNGKPLYVRGTSYFPDVYISRMHRMRYLRDLQAIKMAGFNLIRVHVHVEKPELYDLCDRMGIAVIQDSEYNWNQPRTSEWAETFVRLFVSTVKTLDRHASVFSWICLNEPGVVDVPKGTQGTAMQVSPGPAIYREVTRTDPTRPVIKGSYCADDLTSGDSHNYTGSLDTPPTSYTLIDGTKEKFNTEFGFDAPGYFGNLRNLGTLTERIAALEPLTGTLQRYQTELLKYYIEHYRCQRAAPNWGYVQFMFIDLCPQSFYGLLDWWGQPKPAYEVVARINQPIGVFLNRCSKKISGLVVANDSPKDLGQVSVTWRFVNSQGYEVLKGNASISLAPFSSVQIQEVSLASQQNDGDDLSAYLTLCDGEKRVLASNSYDSVFSHPEHPSGHPVRLSHEFGVRLYSA